MTTPKLELPELVANQSQPHLTINAALRKLDTLVQLTVISRAANTPPASPSEGDVYIIGNAPTGAWGLFAEHELAFYAGTAWVSLTPREGWTAWVNAEASQFIFNGSTWAASGGGGGGGGGGAGNLTVLSRGVNTPPVSPAEGDYYIVGAAPTDAWAGYAVNSLAKYFIGEWTEIEPTEGQVVWVTDENKFYFFYVTWQAQTGNVLVDAAWNAKGDLLVGTGADTAAILSSNAVADGWMLVRSAADSVGLKWKEPASYVGENVGGGIGLYKTTFDGAGEVWIHQFYSLAAGANVSFSQVGNLITISATGGGGGGIVDGDYGDITVTGGGTIWTIDPTTITKAKMANALPLSVIGRGANSSGVVADISAGTDGFVLRRVGSTLAFGQLVWACYADNSVLYDKLGDLSAASRLLGRGSSAGAGDPQEIQIGGGLTMTGTVLSASGAASGPSNADANQYNGLRSGPQVGFSTDTYLFGSDVALSDGVNTPHEGTWFRIKISLTKTNVGTGAPTLRLRLGQNSTLADAILATITFGVSTAIADSCVIELMANFRTVGSGTSAQMTVVGSLIHNLSATGFSLLPAQVQVATSALFDSTIVGDYLGVSLNGGTSANWTLNMVQAELCNMA